MADDGTAFAAIGETMSFLNYFNDLPDYRQAGKVDYPLPEVLLLILLAVLAGAEAFTDIARFGEKKLELLRRFLPFKNGTPAHDHSAIFSRRSTPGPSRPALSHGWRRERTHRLRSSTSMARHRAARIKRRARRRRSTWSRPSPHVNASCWVR